MHKYVSCIFWGALLMTAFVACSKAPKGVIPEKKMENILYDSYIGEGISETVPVNTSMNEPNARRQYLFSVLKKYEVTKAEYDSSLNWYMQNLPIYMKVYDHVIARLKKEQKKVQVEKGEVLQQENIAAGDTVNIWTRTNTAMLNDLPVYGHVFSEINANQGFQLNDHYKFTANVRTLKRAGATSARMVLTIAYTNDSVQTVSREIAGCSRLELQLKTSPNRQVDKVIAGFSQNGSGIVMIDNISLLRIHEKKP